MKVVNLAGRPFQNRRPLRRLSAMLWVAVAVFGLLDLWLFWDHLTGFSTTTGKLTDVREAIERENQDIERLGEDIAELSLAEQNTEVAALNDIIADRVFPWGLLFDHLEQILPDQVWLTSVSPSRDNDESRLRRTRNPRGSRSGRNRRTRQATTALNTEQPTGVNLVLRCIARDNDALRSFLDRLFESPVFESPHVPGQANNAQRQVEFSLNVVFRVDLAQEARRAARVEAERARRAAEGGDEIAEIEADGAGSDSRGSSGPNSRGPGSSGLGSSGPGSSGIGGDPRDAMIADDERRFGDDDDEPNNEPINGGLASAIDPRRPGGATSSGTARTGATPFQPSIPPTRPGSAVTTGRPATLPTQPDPARPTTRRPGSERAPSTPATDSSPGDRRSTTDPPRPDAPPQRPDEALEEPVRPTPNASATARTGGGGGR